MSAHDLGFDKDDWEAFLAEARAWEGTLVHQFLSAEFARLHAVEAADLDDPTRTRDQAQFTRGVREGLKRGILMLEDLVDRAQRRHARATRSKGSS